MTLGGLRQMYDGAPKTVTVTTDPAGLAVTVTYDGSETAPSAAGAYVVRPRSWSRATRSASGEFLIARILYTTPGGLASGVCDTWAAACTLQHALDTVAQNGDEIWVQAGTYHGGFDLRSGIRVSRRVRGR